MCADYDRYLAARAAAHFAAEDTAVDGEPTKPASVDEYGRPPSHPDYGFRYGPSLDRCPSCGWTGDSWYSDGLCPTCGVDCKEYNEDDPRIDR